MNVRIRKAVLPVAGLGTRFLPVTKVLPKELLPIVDKPLIQYAVEEAILAGIDEIIFVNNHDKQIIEDHFKQAKNLESELVKKNRKKELELINPFKSLDIKFTTVFQDEPKGLGHAVLCAAEQVGVEPFAVILPDDLIYHADTGVLKQMIEVFNRCQSAVIAVENIAPEETDKYGIVSTIDPQGKISSITKIVEKPKPGEAESTLAVVGRYILPGEIFSILEKTLPGNSGEIQLTDAISTLLQQESAVAYEFEGKRYDCGSKLGYLQANVEYGLVQPDYGEKFGKFLSGIVKALQ